MAKVIEFRIVESSKEPVSGDPFKAVTTIDDSEITIDEIQECLQFLVDSETRETFDFGTAISLLKDGVKLSRKGWNGKGMWIELFQPDEYSHITRPYIYHVAPMGSTNHYGDDTREFNRVPWLPSNTDILAEDWFIVHD